MFEPIPQEWLRDYVFKLIEQSETVPNLSVRSELLLRAHNIMDMVEEWRLQK